MKAFPTDMQFIYPWRSYQARVLAELGSHLKDKRLHVVAAPGSGKTVLGLEVMKRLDKPTVILAPTITIRNQWVERLMDLFLQTKKKPDWISTDLRKPAFLTVVTYQALYSIASQGLDGSADDEMLREIEGLKKQKTPKHLKKNSKQLFAHLFHDIVVGTIIVDEAHHLRAAWWKSLKAFQKTFSDATLVSLTATPPYDVSWTEWQRYKTLCGPEDAQVTVPELVQEGNLCAHQDFVYLSTPLEEEEQVIQDFKANVLAVQQSCFEDPAFIETLSQHPYVVDPDKHVKQILDDPGYYSSVLLFLRETGQQITRQQAAVLGLSRSDFPQWNPGWLGILFTGFFFTDVQHDAHQRTFKELLRHLRRIGAVDRKRIHLENPVEIQKMLARSLSKLESIQKIVHIEHGQLKNQLRMVVLCDYIRKSELPKNPKDIRPLTKLGVVPVFESLRRQIGPSLQIGVLTGSLMIIPNTSLPLLHKIMEEMGIEKKTLSSSALPHTKDYVQIDLRGAGQERKVHLITELFSHGGIHCLVGTKSLLGEGWDAPAINSLILATFVGSYVLSNQMRGRAIRIHSQQPNKTANIWHLVCVEPKADHPGHDYSKMKRRFKAFLGLSHTAQMIENGLERVNIGKGPYTHKSVEQINQRTCEHALQRASLQERWYQALGLGKDGLRVVHEIKAPRQGLPRGFVLRNTIAAVMWQGILWGSSVLSFFWNGFLNNIQRFEDLFGLAVYVGVGCALAAILALPSFLRSIWLFLRHGSASTSMGLVGRVVLKSLIDIGGIKTEEHQLSVVTESGKHGTVFCSLEGGTSYEKALFLDTLEEIFEPIQNPRYLIIRKSFLGKLLRQDYHSVPQILAKHKKTAQQFAKYWSRYVGTTQLVYTRSKKGRRVLLKARSQSLSASFQHWSERLSRWK